MFVLISTLYSQRFSAFCKLSRLISHHCSFWEKSAVRHVPSFYITFCWIIDYRTYKSPMSLYLSKDNFNLSVRQWFSIKEHFFYKIIFQSLFWYRVIMLSIDYIICYIDIFCILINCIYWKWRIKSPGTSYIRNPKMRKLICVRRKTNVKEDVWYKTLDKTNRANE